MQIIDFAEARIAYTNHKHWVNVAHELLTTIQRDLFTTALNIATTGVWRKWNGTIPDGTTLEFDIDSLRNCGDDDVTQLIELLFSIERIQLSPVERSDQDLT